MTGSIHPTPRSFAAAPRQPAAAASDQSAIERLSFELFGDLDGDVGSDVPGDRRTPADRQAPSAGEKPASPAPFSSPTFNSFAALAAYDSTLRRPERVMSEPRAPAHLGEQVRGHGVYAQTSRTESGEESPGLVLDYRS